MTHAAQKLTPTRKAELEQNGLVLNGNNDGDDAYNNDDDADYISD